MTTMRIRHPRNNTKLDQDFYVTHQDRHAAHRGKQLNALNNMLPSSMPMSPPSAPTRLTEAVVFDHYTDPYDSSLDLLDDDMPLETDPSFPPVQMLLHRLPIAVRDRVQLELKKLTDQGVIQPVTEPTPWVSALLIASKRDGERDGGIRLCIDPTLLNRALQRSTYYMPTLDDVLSNLSDVKVFSTADIKDALWHLKLDYESSLITTFETPFGRYRWCRLAQGLSPSPEIWQSRINTALAGLKGVFCIADDILITGSGGDIATAEREHDNNLQAMLDRCRAKNLKLNKAKFQLRQTSMTFMGQELTSSSLRPDQSPSNLPPNLRAFHTFSEELSSSNGLVL